MFFLKLAAISFTLLSAANIGFDSGLVVVRQDSTRTAHVEEINSNTGDTVTASSLSFKYSQPYVEMTTDASSGLTYLAAFPDGYTYPVLYELERDMTVSYTWANNTFTFWDMQVSPLQSTLYGILVTEDFNGGMYGRTLSNYTTDKASNTISATQLYTLPYMWYVNASSFDKNACVYYALINNFPGKDNSTMEQQLVVADFSLSTVAATTDLEDSFSEESVVTVDVSSASIMLQFIAYSAKHQSVFFTGPSKASAAKRGFVGVLDPSSGRVSRVLLEEEGVVAVGPVVADDDHDRILFYLKYSSEPNEWRLFSMPYMREAFQWGAAEQVATFTGDDFAAFGAAAYMTL